MRVQQGWKLFQQYSGVRLVVKLCCIGLAGFAFLTITAALNVSGAHAQSSCASGDRAHVVVRGETLGGIARRYGISWRRLASYNHLANPNLIFANHVICVPGQGRASGTSGNSQPTHTHPVNNHPTQSHPSRGGSNPFPYGQCTWYADQRYFQLHGIYVPWRNQANAYQWTARAYQYGWHVSRTPVRGAIIDLQPWTQGAYSLGHVGVVERVLSNGHVIASNLSWGMYRWRVVYVEFAPGPGVTFITQ